MANLDLLTVRELSEVLDIDLPNLKEKIRACRETGKLSDYGKKGGDTRQAYQYDRREVEDVIYATSSRGRIPPQYNNFWRLEGDWIIASDFHVPFHDCDFILTMLHFAKDKGIRKLLIGGDFMNCDDYSSFFSMVNPIPWSDEKDIARDLLIDLANHFDEIKVLTGNHELRFLRKLERGDINDLWGSVTYVLRDNIKDKIQFSMYPYCQINGNIQCEHGKYRQIPLSLGRARHANTHMNMVIFHGHQTGFCYAPNGKHKLFDCGLMADPLKFDYKQINPTTHFEWSQSFLWLEDGRMRHYLKDEYDLYDPRKDWEKGR